MGQACSRRRADEKVAFGVKEEETPFWEHPTVKSNENIDERKDPPGYKQAALLKEEGNAKFARGDASSVEEAMESWVHALDSLCMPPDRPEEDDSGPDPADDALVQELRVSVLLNLAAGHRKQKQWRSAVSYCDEVLADQPANAKALFRRADSLGELCEWEAAEKAAALLEATGEEGLRLASQRRQEWRRRQKVADGKQKKMWSAALADAKAAPKAGAKAGTSGADGTAGTEPAKGDGGKALAEPWVTPKVSQMSVFDLRCSHVKWDEKEDFDDKIWKLSLGRRDAAFYQKKALPLTLLAASALAELELPEALIVHCLLDGNMAPFVQPHDWSAFLQRAPAVKNLMVVYIDLGAVGDISAGGPPQMPYGTLLRPTEEGRSGDRVALCARFLGTYKEFHDHCKDLPGLVKPHLAFWADVPLYGFHDDDLGVRLEALNLLTAAGVPSIVTQGGEVQEPGAPSFTMKLDEAANLSCAILRVGLSARTVASWHWNRFVVPLDRGEYGIVAAHAVVGVVRLPKTAAKPCPSSVRRALKARDVTPAPFRMATPGASEKEFERVRKKQWEAFSRKLVAEGRPAGPAATEEERNRQAMEFYQFCGMNDAAGNST